MLLYDGSNCSYSPESGLCGAKENCYAEIVRNTQFPSGGFRKLAIFLRKLVLAVAAQSLMMTGRRPQNCCEH